MEQIQKTAAELANEKAQESQTLESEVVFTDQEKAAMDTELAKKVATLTAQKIHQRTKREEAEKALNELKTQSMQKAPDPAQSVVVPSTVDVAQAAKKVVMDIERDKLIASFPEEKRSSVREIFTALTAGKEVDATNISSFIETAGRAVGVELNVNNSNKIISTSGGNLPPRTPPGPSKEQIGFAKMIGNDPEAVYGQNADFSRLAGADKFV